MWLSISFLSLVTVTTAVHILCLEQHSATIIYHWAWSSDISIVFLRCIFLNIPVSQVEAAVPLIWLVAASSFKARSTVTFDSNWRLEERCPFIRILKRVLRRAPRTSKHRVESHHRNYCRGGRPCSRVVSLPSYCACRLFHSHPSWTLTFSNSE